ncbi:hypothetical protein BASA81_003803 [Batrachochytrium salamandrivorans]|nr:hypothetical protein BASA81_003803 [Batrachochytrium salamandrivorans]
MQQQQPNTERMEAVFFRLYSGIIFWITNRTSPACRTVIEIFTLGNALVMLAILLWFHLWYVTWAADNCFTQTLHRELERLGPQPLIKIQIGGIWNQLGLENNSPEMSLFKQNVLYGRDLDVLDVWLKDPTFLFSTERAFLSLDAKKREEFGITESFLTLNTDECFAANSGLRGEVEWFLLTNFIGWETVLLNALAVRFDHGSLFSMHSREILTIQPSTLPFWFKLTAICTTLFLFCITTTLVHHTLRETQERMLNFTLELQGRIHAGLPYRHLVLNHLMASLAFVPIMVGMLFFLFEFYNNQLLAFMVMSIVWVCELYSVVSLRTRENVQSFPKLFFLYFCSFHLYFFLFPTGFSYIALTCCVTFLQFAMWSFFVRWELPAFHLGKISNTRRRDWAQGSGGAASLALQAVIVGGERAGTVEEPVEPPPPLLARVPEPANVPEPQPKQAEGDSVSVSLPAPGGRKKRTTINKPPEALPAPAATTDSPMSLPMHPHRHSPSAAPPTATATATAWEVETQSSGGDWQIGHE